MAQFLWSADYQNNFEHIYFVNNVKEIDISIDEYNVLHGDRIKNSVQNFNVYWKYSDEDGPYSIFNLDFELDNKYSGSFPVLNFQQEIEYFIKVTNIEEKTISHPIAGWHSFVINSIAGDVNGDTLLNIQDVILIVNLVLSNQFNPSADLNGDNQINIQDIVLLVNIILN